MVLMEDFLAVAISLLLLYLFFYNHKVRWVRLMGCGLIITVGLAAGAVQETVPMLVLALVNMAIAGQRLVTEIVSIFEGI